MGEPLWNYEAVVKSLRLLGNEVGISLRNLTVSTVGVVPGIRALAKEDLPITLALSLHAPDDELRATLIPTARKWKLDEILDACAEYTRRHASQPDLRVSADRRRQRQPGAGARAGRAAQVEATARQCQPDPVQLCGDAAGLPPAHAGEHRALPCRTGEIGPDCDPENDARPCYRRRLRPAKAGGGAQSRLHSACRGRGSVIERLVPAATRPRLAPVVLLALLSGCKASLAPVRRAARRHSLASVPSPRHLTKAAAGPEAKHPLELLGAVKGRGWHLPWYERDPKNPKGPPIPMLIADAASGEIARRNGEPEIVMRRVHARGSGRAREPRASRR